MKGPQVLLPPELSLFIYSPWSVHFMSEDGNFPSISFFVFFSFFSLNMYSLFFALVLGFFRVFKLELCSCFEFLSYKLKGVFALPRTAPNTFSLCSEAHFLLFGQSKKKPRVKPRKV